MDAKRFCYGYQDAVYDFLESDKARTEAYRNAINTLVKGKTVLDIGTGGRALLALMCAEAGAKLVYAVESNENAVKNAKEHIKLSYPQYLDTVQVIQGFSTEITLPTKVDMVVHEIIGEIATYEGVCFAVRDAQERHIIQRTLKDRTSIPCRIQSRICPAEFPYENWIRKYKKIPDKTCISSYEFPSQYLLGDFAVFEDINLEEDVKKKYEGETSIGITRDGVMSGLVIHCAFSCLDSEVMECSSWTNCDSWMHRLVILKSTDVKEGDAVKIKWLSDVGTIKTGYSFDVCLKRVDGEVVTLPTVSF